MLITTINLQAAAVASYFLDLLFSQASSKKLFTKEPLKCLSWSPHGEKSFKRMTIKQLITREDENILLSNDTEKQIIASIQRTFAET